MDLAAALKRTRLAQGAPTSPALANAVAYRLDRRLLGLCQCVGADYTRYADDLVFSGGVGLLRRWRRLATSVAAVAMEEGFEVNFHKTKLMKQGSQQRVLGIVVNDRAQVPRRDYERLKAILHNCRRFGPAAQNRGQHPRFRQSLRGGIAHVARFNPVRGRKLMEVFQAIDWSPDGAP